MKNVCKFYFRSDFRQSAVQISDSVCNQDSLERDTIELTEIQTSSDFRHSPYLSYFFKPLHRKLIMVYKCGKQKCQIASKSVRCAKGHITSVGGAKLHLKMRDVKKGF